MADVVDQTVSNPQPLVDAALGVTSEVKSPLSPLEPLSQSIPPVITTNPPTTSTTPEVKVGDETPLAFMTPITPPTQSGVIPNNPIISQNQNFPEEQKQKKGKGKVVGLVVGLFLLLAGLGGGFYFYNSYLPASPSTIAGVYVDSLTREQCNGCYNGGNLVWRNGACKVSGTCEGGNTQGQGHSTVVSCGTTGSVPCNGCGGFCILPIDKTCNQMALEKCGESPVVGASCSTTQDSQFKVSCTCDGKQYYFDSDGICNADDPKAKDTTDPSYYDTYGLCGVVKTAGCSGSKETGGNGTACKFTCDSNGCSCDANDANCSVYHWKCDRNTDLAGGCQDGTPKVGKSATFNANCGSEQIDVRCGAGSVGFRTKTYSTACGAKASAPPKTNDYSLSCTGLTKDVVAPTIGSKITFTCAGATVPAVGETLLKYNFRYSLDSGAWKALTNKTNTTTELTVAACGSYNVQCRACVTYGGKTQCDPIWQGATQ